MVSWAELLYAAVYTLHLYRKLTRTILRSGHAALATELRTPFFSVRRRQGLVTKASTVSSTPLGSTSESNAKISLFKSTEIDILNGPLRVRGT